MKNQCSERLAALSTNLMTSSNNEGTTSVGVSVCDTNNNNVGATSLMQEPGIPELQELYYDDHFDPETGKFTAMSESTAAQYAKDVQAFYMTFTGASSPDPSITSFSDISLRQFQSLPQCQGPQAPFRQSFVVSNDNSLLVRYAEQVKQMMRKTNSIHRDLMEVLNTLFAFSADNVHIRVHPDLTDTGLQRAVNKTRGLLTRLYITCEIDYLKALQLFESLVEQHMLTTTQQQLDHLEHLADQLSAEDVI